MNKIVTMRDKGMQELARRAIGGGRLRLQDELNRIVGMSITMTQKPFITINATTEQRHGGIISDCSCNGQFGEDAFRDLELFKGIRNLKIAGGEAGKIYPHKWSTSIESLTLANPAVAQSVIPHLDRLVNLKKLSLTLEDDLELPLTRETKARLTYFSGVGGEDYSFLEGCDKLEELHIKDGGAKAFLTLPKLPAVKRLDIVGLKSCKLSGVERLPRLEYLNLSNSNLSDLSALVTLKNLTTVGLCSSNLSDISPLAGLPVETLDISSNMVEDISPLAGKESLVYLDLTSNPIEDISPLVGCTNMELLHLHDTWVSDLSPLFGMKNLQELSVDLRFIKDKRQFRQLSHVATINGRYFADFMEHNALDL